MVHDRRATLGFLSIALYPAIVAVLSIPNLWAFTFIRLSTPPVYKGRRMAVMICRLFKPMFPQSKTVLLCFVITTQSTEVNFLGFPSSPFIGYLSFVQNWQWTRNYAKTCASLGIINSGCPPASHIVFNHLPSRTTVRLFDSTNTRPIIVRIFLQTILLDVPLRHDI
jgi:hypothetical protein